MENDADTIERLTRRNEFLTSLCRDLAELLAGFMKAAGHDDPRLMELPHYVAGQKKMEEIRLYFENAEGEVN